MKLALLLAWPVGFLLGWIGCVIFQKRRDRKLAAKLKRASDDLAKAVENQSNSLGPDQPGIDKQK